MTAAADEQLRIVVMGVSGAGKTTVGSALAERLGCSFVDADSLHPPANVAKMASGHALADADRRPWLERVRVELAWSDRVVMACSALTRSARDLLRGADGVRFVFLDLDAALAGRRLRDRVGHFMPAALVDSQFAALERPSSDEVDVITVDAHADVDRIVELVISQL